MAAIAVQTSRIRVGSAGIMLPHYSSLKVAEQFRVLDALAPGRIDLGLGRAPGSDGRTAFALNPNAQNAADHFPGRGARPAGLAERAHAGRGPSVPRYPRPAIGTRRCRKPGFSAAPILARRSPRISACLSASPISSPTAPASKTAMDVYREGFRPGVLAAPHGCAVRLGAWRRKRRRRPTGWFSSRALWRLGRDRGIYTGAADRGGGRRLRRIRSQERATLSRQCAETALFGTPERRRSRRLRSELAAECMAPTRSPC